MGCSVATQRIWKSALLASAAAAALTATPAAAQVVVEEIIVSAQRRDQSLQDVPVAVSAFSAEQLEKIAVPDITYLNQAVPNVTVERSRATNSTITAFIRGVGQQDPVAGFEQGVGLYIDDVYINRPTGAILDVYDVERIEVLRGPQGTLYGRNTIGGAIKYVTRRLPDEPEFKLRLSGGTFGQIDAVGTFAAPITDTLRVGGSVATFNRNGFGESLETGEENYDKEVIAGRLTIEAEPADNVFIRISGDWTDDSSNPRHGHRLIDGLLTGAPVLDNVFDTRSTMVPPPDPEVINRGISALIEWEVNENWTIKNIIGYRDNESGQLIDFDSLASVDLEAPFALNDDQFSEELQVLYTSDDINVVAGFYYLSADAFNEFDVNLGLTGDLIGLPGLNAYTLGEVGTETWSVYGDATFNLTGLFGAFAESVDAVELTLGGRYTDDKRDARVLRQTILGPSASFGPGGLILATTSDFDGSASFSDFTPRVVLTVKPDDLNTTYFSFSQGFKGGGFDPRGQTTAAPDLNGDGIVSAEEQFSFLDFAPETITNYELGWKTSGFDGRLTANLAIFHAKYKDVQIPGSIGVDADNDGVAEDFSGLITNAGSADFTGVEFEGSAILGEDLGTPGDSFTANWAIGWIDAEYTEFITAVTDPVSGETSLQNIADERVVQNTPEWTFNLSANYARPLSLFGEDGEISFIPSVSYRSFTSQFEFESPIDQPGYTLFDASIVWTSDDGGIQVGLHGKNLGDKEYVVAGYDFLNIASPLGLEGTVTAFYGDPRTVTGTVQLKF